MRTISILLFLAALVGATSLLREGSAAPDEIGAELALLESEDGAGTVSAKERGERAATNVLDTGKPNEAERVSEDASTGASPSKSVFYQWVDERGSVHFAASLDEVPAAWRSRAGQVQLDSGAFNRTPTGAAKPVRPRTIAEAAPRSRVHDVTVYTAPWCGWCRKTLALLDQRGVDYVNKDIEDDADYAQELREKTGGTAIPLVEIDGNAIRGFDPGRMTALLD